MSKTLTYYLYDRTTGKTLIGVAGECFRTDTNASVSTGTSDANGKLEFTGLDTALTYISKAYVPDDIRVFDERTVVDDMRRIPLIPMYDRRTGTAVVFASDTHGDISAIYHIDQADGDANYKVVGFAPVVLPADYVAGAVTLKFLALSDAAGNNYVWDLYVREIGAGAFQQLLGVSEVLAANAVANTLSLHSKALTTNPTADRAIHVEISPNSNHASDSNTGTRSLYSAWLEYTGALD